MEYYGIFNDTLKEVRQNLSEEEYKVLNRRILTFCKNVKKYKEEGFDYAIYTKTFDVENGSLIDFFNFLDEIKEKISDLSYVFLSNKIREICNNIKKPDPEKFESVQKFRDFDHMCSISKLFNNYIHAETKLDLQRIPIPGKSGSHLFIDLVRMDRALEEEYQDIEYNHQRRTILFVIRLDYIMRNIRILEGEKKLIGIYRELIFKKLEKDKFFLRILRDSDFDYRIWLNVFSDFESGKIVFTDEEEIEKCSCYDQTCICLGYKEFKQCRNYDNFIMINPIIEHIYDRDKPIILQKWPLFGKCLPDLIILKNRENLLQLLYSIPNSYIKNIITIALADFLMRNARFLKKNQEQAVMASSGIIGSENDPEFLEILKKNDFDIKIWVNTFIECSLNL